MGIAFGLSLAVLAAYQQLKLPPVLPVLIGSYGFGRILAGGFMSIYALCGLLLSLRLGSVMQRHGTTALLNLSFLLFIAAAAAMMLWPAQGWLFLAARAVEGVAFAILAIAGSAICTANAGTRGLAIASALIATWIPDRRADRKPSDCRPRRLGRLARPLGNWHHCHGGDGFLDRKGAASGPNPFRRRNCPVRAG